MMKWSLFFKEKMKAASILAVLMIAIIASNVVERKINMTNNEIISSIYKDRLTPSVDLFEMRNLNEQRISIFHQLKSGIDFNASLKQEILNINQDFDLLFKKYQNTYLVSEEKIILPLLQNDLKTLDQSFFSTEYSSDEQVESTILRLSAINVSLQKLNKLQEEVGKDLIRTYEKKTYLSSFLNVFQILIAIILGLIILQIVADARMMNLLDRKPINLN